MKERRRFTNCFYTSKPYFLMTPTYVYIWSHCLYKVIWDSLWSQSWKILWESISAEPLVQQVVSQVVAPVPQLTAGMLPVQPAVEIGQPPALREDGAGQVWTSVIEIPRNHLSQSHIQRAKYPVKPWHANISRRLPAVVGDLAVVAGSHEPRQHPPLRRSSHRGPGPASCPAAASALIISPLQICATVHSSGSEMTGYTMMI